MTAPDIRLALAPLEGVHLAGLVEEFTQLIAAADDAHDPGIGRLTPTPYPEDADAADEFASATRDDLLDRRTADAAVVRRDLAPLLERAADESVDDDLEPVDVLIPATAIDSWLRTLTALRLVIATRLDVTDDEHDPDDPRFAIFDWLGFRLDGLISLADALDDEPNA